MTDPFQRRRIRLADGSYVKLPWGRMRTRTRRERAGSRVEAGQWPVGPGSAGSVDTSSRLLGRPPQGTRVVLAGCGSVGSHTGHALAQMGSDIVAIDKDTVEPSNVEGGRTAYPPETCGMSKVMAFEYSVRRSRSPVTVFPICRDLEDFTDTEVRALAADANVVVASFDDPEQLLRLNGLVYSECPAVYPAFHPRAQSSHVVWTRPDEVPCFRCSVGVRSAAELRTHHGEPAFPGDIRRTSELAARVALWLCASEGEELSGLLHPHNNILFMHNRPSASAEEALAVRFLAADRQPDCQVCRQLG